MTTQDQNMNVQVGLAVVTNQMKDLEKRFDKFETELKKAIADLSNSLDTKYVTKERAENLNTEVQAIRDEVASIRQWFRGLATAIALTIIGAVMKLILK